MKLIPALDLYDGKVVRLEQGDYNKIKVYHEKPVDLAFYFADHGVDRLHLVDLRGSKEGKICEGRIMTEIRRTVNIACEVGGGIRSRDDAQYFFDHGFSQGKDFIMIGSLPFTDRSAFDKIAEDFAQSILMTVDVWGREVKHSGWLKSAGTQVFDLIGDLEKMHLKNFLVTQIKKDGMLTGPDFELYEELQSRFPAVKLIASGGVSSMKDLEQLAEKNLFGAIIGRAYYEHKITAQAIKDFIDG